MFYTYVSQTSQNCIYARGYDDNGKRVEYRKNFQPTLYVYAGEEQTRWKTLDGKHLKPIQCESIKAARTFAESYPQPVFGNDRFIFSFIAEDFNGYVPDYSKIKIAYIDIETELEHGKFPNPSDPPERVSLITVKIGKHIKTFGLLGEASIEGVEYHSYSDEADMLNDFLEYWKQSDIDVITGWNIKKFDILFGQSY